MTVIPRSFAVGRLKFYRNIYVSVWETVTWYFLRTIFGPGIYSFPSV